MLFEIVEDTNSRNTSILFYQCIFLIFKDILTLNVGCFKVPNFRCARPKARRAAPKRWRRSTRWRPDEMSKTCCRPTALDSSCSFRATWPLFKVNVCVRLDVAALAVASWTRAECKMFTLLMYCLCVDICVAVLKIQMSRVCVFAIPYQIKQSDPTQRSIPLPTYLQIRLLVFAAKRMGVNTCQRWLMELLLFVSFLLQAFTNTFDPTMN